jgi:DNA-binding CsgD family transcriptional regulator
MTQRPALGPGARAVPAGDASRAGGTAARPAGASPARPGRDSITAEARSLHRVLLLHGGLPDAELCSRTRTPPERVRSCLAELAGLGLVTITGGAVTAVPHAQAVESLLAAQDAILEQALETVRQARRRLNVLIREGTALSGDGVGTVLAAPPGEDPDRAFHAAQARPAAGVAALHPGTRFSRELLAVSLRRAAAQLARGLTLRVIHQSAALSHPHSAEYFRQVERLGGQVRFSDLLPFRLVLIDGTTAVCRLEDPGGAPESLLFQGPRMLGLLGGLFETAWIQAAPLTRAAPPPAAAPGAPPPLTGQHQTIVRCLADGATDQAIARQLGITTRTVARRINEIYEALGVQSRFQAGAMARRRGLI